MKKIYAYLLIVLVVLPLPVLARTFLAHRRLAFQTVGCATLLQENNNESGPGTQAGGVYTATKITATSSPSGPHSICSLSFWHMSVPTGGAMVYDIYDHNGGTDEPGSIISNGTSDSVDWADVVSNGWTDVTFSTPPSLTAGTTYWIIANASSATGGGTTYKSNNGSPERVMKAGTPPTWSLVTSSRALRYRLFTE